MELSETIAYLGYVTQIEGVTIDHLLQKAGFSLKHSLQLNFCEYLWHLNTLFVRFVCLIYSDILGVCTVDLEFRVIHKLCQGVRGPNI